MKMFRQEIEILARDLDHRVIFCESS